MWPNMLRIHDQICWDYATKYIVTNRRGKKCKLGGNWSWAGFAKPHCTWRTWQWFALYLTPPVHPIPLIAPRCYIHLTLCFLNLDYFDYFDLKWLFSSHCDIFLLKDSKDDVAVCKRPIERSEDAIASSRVIFISFAEETTERLLRFQILCQPHGGGGGTWQQGMPLLYVNSPV